MESYKIVSKGKKEISLTANGELEPISAEVGKILANSKQKLSKIIKDLNDAFGTNFTEEDRVFLGRIKDNLLENKDLQNKIEHNSKENVRTVFDKYFSEEMTKLLNNNMEFYKRIIDNEKLRKRLKSQLFNLVYSEYEKLKKNKTKNS